MILFMIFKPNGEKKTHPSPIRIENIKMFNIVNNDDQKMGESKAFIKYKIWIYYVILDLQGNLEKWARLLQECFGENITMSNSLIFLKVFIVSMPPLFILLLFLPRKPFSSTHGTTLQLSICFLPRAVVYHHMSQSSGLKRSEVPPILKSEVWESI